MTIAEMMEAANSTLARSLGMQYKTSPKGFTQGEIYQLAGRNDLVVNLRLRSGSESAELYGDELTVCFIYTQKERKALEEDFEALDETSFVKARELLDSFDEEKKKLLETTGINIHDITEMLIAPYSKECNTFPSKSKRELNVHQIEFEPYGNGEDITWEYGFLRKLKREGVALTPEEDAEYLAYKFILDEESLTDDEKKIIFNNQGAMKDEKVAYSFLLWKEEAHKMTAKDIAVLKNLKNRRIQKRLEQTDKELRKMGLGLKKLAELSPKKATLLLKKILNFHEVRYNLSGKHLLYCNFGTLLHVYLRHVEELKLSNQFEDRDKFQLHEEDVMKVMEHVMTSLNDEYQAYKEEHPYGRFYRAGKMAYYFNGDYYNVNVNADGSISTFYKASGNKKEGK